MTWTRFWDMNSGGGRKEDFRFCFIEASEDEAKSVFYSRFGHSPDRVTCTCCGEDYVVEEVGETLEEATSGQRAWSNYRQYPADLEEFLAHEDVFVIYAKDIEDHERTADVPEQGYVWVD